MDLTDLPVRTTVEHLIRMKEVLRDLPQHQFDMRSWKNEFNCGTTYCLLGAYIETDKEQTGLQFIGYYPTLISQSHIDTPEYMNPGMHAASIAFGLRVSECIYLFHPESYCKFDSEINCWRKITKDIVTKRLDELILLYS